MGARSQFLSVKVAQVKHSGAHPDVGLPSARRVSDKAHSFVSRRAGFAPAQARLLGISQNF